jgi:hypothetical protein
MRGLASALTLASPHSRNPDREDFDHAEASYTLFDKCKVAAQATIDLINHRQTPDRISDAVIETLIEMSAETLLQIWDKETGINLVTLAGLYSLQKRGSRPSPCSSLQSL